MPAVDVGEMRWRATPQAATKTADASGQMIPTWNDEGAFWAKFEQVGGSEQTIAGQVRSIVYGTLTFRAGQPLTANKRLKINGQGLTDLIVNIDAILASDGSGFQSAKVTQVPAGAIQ